MGYLPSVSAVAFSLSCMHLKYSLGPDHFAKVSSSDEDNLRCWRSWQSIYQITLSAFLAKGYTASKTLTDITAQHTAPLGACIPLYTFPPV
jgi:hypothetical protein